MLDCRIQYGHMIIEHIIKLLTFCRQIMNLLWTWTYLKGYKVFFMDALQMNECSKYVWLVHNSWKTFTRIKNKKKNWRENL